VVFRATCAAALLSIAGRADAVSWWLPANYSRHGVEMDYLFTLVFIITSVVMLGVFAAMVYFLVRYRHDPNRKKAHFTHGNTKIEMLWTIVPAIILIVISLYSKGVWDRYRHGDEVDHSAKPARLLVIGQQFQWNVVYAGPDGKLGRYLVYPKPTDRVWPKNADGTAKTFSFGKYQDTKGPADMPFDDALGAINAYIDQENPLGKVFDDPDGKDDNFDPQPGRPIEIPKGRPVEVQLSSKDVIHDFFLPNMRVKLDAVPGLRGVLNFTATQTSKEVQGLPENRRTYTDLDALAASLADPVVATMLLDVNEKSQPKAPDAKSAGTAFDRNAGEWKYNDKEGKTIIREGQPLTKERVAQLKAIGVKEITIYRPQFDLVCEELCGQGHGKMQGRVIVITPEEFVQKYETASDSASGKADDRTAVTRR
jgi:heme/copper-type cytochrome/quinol oxidase subunit 2